MLYQILYYLESNLFATLKPLFLKQNFSIVSNLSSLSPKGLINNVKILKLKSLLKYV